MSIPELSFTGPSRLSPLEEAWCRAELRELRLSSAGLSTWRSGGAHGLDTLVVEESGVHQDVKLYVPDGCHWNYSLDESFDFAEFIRVTGGYRARNEMLVRGSDELHAFLRSPVFYRSGEWMTKNIATRAGVPVIDHIIPQEHAP